MTFRLSDAFVSIARNPLPFVLTVLFFRILPRGLAWMGVLMAIGFLLSVLRAALRADSAPLPSSRELPSAAMSGCAVGCGLWSAGIFVLMFIVTPLGWWLQAHPQVHLAVSFLPAWWAGHAWFCAGVLATGQVKGSVVNPGGFFGCLWCILKRPPLNLSGLGLLGLFAASVASCWILEGSDALCQAIPLGLWTLYVHCLGQHLRRDFGLELV